MSLCAGSLRPIEAIEGPLTNRSRDAVLLTFHSIHPSGPRYLSVTPDASERQLVALARHGYGRGRLDDLERLRANRCPSPWRSSPSTTGHRFAFALPPLSHAKVSAMTIPRIPVKALNGAGARWVKGFTKANGGKRIRVERLVGHNAP